MNLNQRQHKVSGLNSHLIVLKHEYDTKQPSFMNTRIHYFHFAIMINENLYLSPDHREVKIAVILVVVPQFLSRLFDPYPLFDPIPVERVLVLSDHI
jgi:hypothetical protein